MVRATTKGVPALDGEGWRPAYRAICDTYRRALFNANYNGRRLRSLNRANLALELGAAILAPSGIAGLTILKSSIDPLWSTLVATSGALLAAVKPILQLGKKAQRYSVQHAAYLDVYLAYRAVVERIQVAGRVTPESWRHHETLRARYQALARESDPNPSDRVRDALKAEVERQIPTDSLRIDA